MSSARALNTASLRPEKSGFCRPLFLSQRRCIIFNCLEDHPSAGKRERDAPATRRESCAPAAEQEEDVVPFAGKRRLIVFGSANDVYAAALSPARKEQITRQRRLPIFFFFLPQVRPKSFPFSAPFLQPH
jgi:hypothetical protein